MIFKTLNWFLFLIFSILLVSSCSKKTKHPIVGDEYIVTTEAKTYTTYKVVKASKHLVWYIQNDYEVSEKMYLDSIINKQPYTDTPTKIKREDFNALNLIYYQNKETVQKN